MDDQAYNQDLGMRFNPSTRPNLQLQSVVFIVNLPISSPEQQELNIRYRIPQPEERIHVPIPMIPLPEAFIRDEDESWPVFLDYEEEDMDYEQEEVVSLRTLCLTVIQNNIKKLRTHLEKLPVSLKAEVSGSSRCL